MKHKQILSFLIVFAMLVGMFGGTGVFAAAADEEDTSSTADEIPDYIQTANIGGVEYLLFDSGEDMVWLRQHVLAGGDSGVHDGSLTAEGAYCTHNIMLTADIDMTEYNGLDSEGGTLNGEGYNNGIYSGIGYGQQGLGYSGIFDGNGHTISNLDVYVYYKETVGPKGLLFNLTKDATIQNLVVQGKIDTNRYTGGLIGRATGSLTIKNVVVNADAKLSNAASNAVGGLIGQLGAGRTYTSSAVTIENCAVVGTYTSETDGNQVGGLIGHIYGGFNVTIKNCYAAAELNAALTAGLVSSNGTGTLSIKNCYYLDSMADTSIITMTGSTADASPVGPDSAFVDATSLSEAVMKSTAFISRLGEGNFKADKSAAGGYPVPAAIGAYDAEFMWAGSPVLEYNVGDTFDLTGLYIYAPSEDGGSNVDITSYAQVSKTDALTLTDDGITVTVTVVYGGNVETKDYTIAVKDLRDLVLTSGPEKTEYYEGDKFDPTGMVVTGTFGDAEEKIEVETYTYTPYGALTLDDTTVVVNYLGKTIEIPIKVEPRYLYKIEVTPPTSLIYAADEEPNPDDMVVLAYYVHAPETAVVLPAAANGEAGYTYSVDKASGTVTVSYTEKTATMTDSFQVAFLESDAPAIVDGVCQLSNADHLVWFANQANALMTSYDAVLLNDIDLTDAALFKPIGSLAIPYTGYFDGNGHTVTLRINEDSSIDSFSLIGLFGAISNAAIKNTTVAGSITTPSGGGVSYSRIGGIVGNAANSIIDGCINEAEINAYANYVGGIVGYAQNTNAAATMLITNCVNTGSVVSVGNWLHVGGIAGYANGSSGTTTILNIENCSNYGEIRGGNRTGGIVGAHSGSIRNCHNSGTIVSSGSAVGGIVGYKASLYIMGAECEIVNLSNTGDVTGSSITGGIVGTLESGGRNTASQVHVLVQNVYNTGNIEATSSSGLCGGIVGSNHSIGYRTSSSGPKDVVVEVKNAYNSGNVTAPTAVGGIIGRDATTSAQYVSGTHTIQNVYNTGAVALTPDSEGTIGVIVGTYTDISGAEVSREISNAYYLHDESDLAAYNTADGLEIAITSVEAKASDELKDASILELLGDGFTLAHSETVNDGYPILAWQLETLPDDAHDWDEGVVTKEPTYTEEGEITYTCLTCGETKVEVLAKLTPPSSGGTATAPTENAVTAAECENGTVAVSPEKAKQGDTVTVTVTPDEGWELDKLTVLDADGKEIAVTEKDGVYTFTMPAGAVRVTAAFKAVEQTSAKEMVFTDVSADDWFYDDVKYVFEKDLMNGTGETLFSPSLAVSRAMIVTILYRLEGEPAVTGGNAFTDVPADEWYTDAVIWAAQNSIVLGYGDGAFGPTDNITREQMAAILYRYAQFKGYDTTASADLGAFTDADQISAYALPAMRWANAEGLINGVGGGLIEAQGSAVRSQAAAILARFCRNIAEI